MNSPGAKNMAFGLLWFVIGMLVTVGSAKGGGHVVVAFGAIFVGAGQFLVGLVQFFSGDKQSQVDRVLPQATIEFKALLRTMIAAAECDNPLDNAEVESIRAMLKQLIGKDFYMIRDVSAAMAKDGVKASDYLATVQSDLSLEIKQLVLRASTILLVNGNTEGARAMQFLQEIADALRLTDQQCEDATEGVTRQPAGAAAHAV